MDLLMGGFTFTLKFECQLVVPIFLKKMVLLI